jgi:hypothetical protein
VPRNSRRGEASASRLAVLGFSLEVWNE